MAQAAAHLEQVAQRNLGAWIARTLPHLDWDRIVKRKLAVGDQHPDQHRSNGFRHRPADEAGVRIVTFAIAFCSQLAVNEQDQRAGFAQALLGEQVVDLPRQLVARGSGLVGDGSEGFVGQRSGRQPFG